MTGYIPYHHIYPCQASGCHYHRGICIVCNKQPSPFKSLDSYKLKGRGTIHIISNPASCDDFDHIIKHYVNISIEDEDGDTPHINSYVIGVEHHCNLPPYSKGINIGLLIKDGA
jgi:hypothetical protein